MTDIRHQTTTTRLLFGVGRSGRAAHDSEAATETAADRGLCVAQILVGFRLDGGAERLVRTFLYEMRAAPGSTTVITLKPGAKGSADELSALGADLVALPARRLIDPVRFVRLLRILRRGRFDVVHTHLTGANIVGVLAARLLRIPAVVTLHSTHSASDDHWYHGRLERLVLRRLATTVIAVGEETAATQAVRIGRSDIVVMPNAVTASEPIDAEHRAALRREIMSDPSGRLVLAVGRLEPPKAHDDLVTAFAELVERRPDAELAIVGRGSLRNDVESLVERCGLADRVHFLGVRQDVRDLMRACDLYALSSRWEGLPMVLLEAMECELPIVATDVGDIATLLAGTGARVVPPEQPAAFASALVDALDDLDAGRDLTSAAASVLRRQYSSPAWASELHGRYLELVR